MHGPEAGHRHGDLQGQGLALDAVVGLDPDAARWGHAPGV